MKRRNQSEKMEKIALVEPSSQRNIENLFYQITRIMEPLGLCCIASTLKEQGLVAKIFQQLDTDNSSFLREIEAFGPDLAGFSCLSNSFQRGLEQSRTLKRDNPRLKTVFGGYHPSLVKEIIFDEAVDYVVLGEGDLTFPMLAKSIFGLSSKSDIPGVVSKENYKSHLPPERIDNLDSLPIPLRDSLPMNRYHSYNIGENEFPQPRYASMHTSRGCLYRCNFCCTPILYPKKVYSRSPRKVVDELEILAREFGINQIDFRDEDIMLNRSRLIAICEDIIQRGLHQKVRWRAFGNVGEVDEPLLRKMEEAGCSVIFYGADGVDNYSLERMRKPYTIDKIRKSFKQTQECGIYTIAGVVIGYPFDTKDMVTKWLNLLKDITPEGIYISLFTPFLGTPIHQELRSEGLILSEDPSDYDCITPIVKNNNVTPKEISNWQKELYFKYYNSKEWKSIAMHNMETRPRARESYTRFIDFMGHHRDIHIAL